MKISIVALTCFLAFPTGCSVFSSGPKMMNTISEGAMSIGTTLAAKMNPKDMTATTGGKINDPRFTFKGHVATGMIFEFNASLTGADLDYNIAAGGQGDLEVDPAIMDRISVIWGNSALNEEQRKNMIAQTIQEWMTNKIKETPKADFTP